MKWTSPAVVVLALLLPASGFAQTKKQPARIAFESGMQYAQSGLYDQAITKFQEAVAIDKKYADAYMNMGVCYIKKGSSYHGTARDLLEQASNLPNGRANPLVWYNLTVVYTVTSVFDRAFSALERTLGLGFRDFDALRADPDLTELRRKPEFRKILERYRVFL